MLSGYEIIELVSNKSPNVVAVPPGEIVPSKISSSKANDVVIVDSIWAHRGTPFGSNKIELSTNKGIGEYNGV